MRLLGKAEPAETRAPLGTSERAAILEQLGRILASERFKHSKRYCGLLKYVVERTLDGSGAELKERTLGVSVFNRRPDYDTSGDPVVRVSAAEIRKRIEEYYSAPDHIRELRIALPVGSYVPEFRQPGTNGQSSTPASPRRSPWFRDWRLWLVCAVVMAGVGWFVVPKRTPDLPGRAKFWRPLTRSGGGMLVVIGPATGVPERPAASGSATPADPRAQLRANDLSARIGWFLRGRGKPFDFELPEQTTLAKLKSGPFILVGGFDNQWTLRCTESLRFHLETGSDPSFRRIVDRKNPDRRDWTLQVPSSGTKDYALVARALDPISGEMMLAIAGLGDYGAAAAIEFLMAKRENLDRFGREAPSGWDRGNIEFVLEVQLINGEWTPPRIVDTEFW